ncbi:hypothetical protein ABK040_015529 [Willaertia magna]
MQEDNNNITTLQIEATEDNEISSGNKVEIIHHSHENYIHCPSLNSLPETPNNETVIVVTNNNTVQYPINETEEIKECQLPTSIERTSVGGKRKSKTANENKTQPPAINPTPIAPPPHRGHNTPSQIMDILKAEGKRKARLTFDQIILLSLLAGFFKGIAGTISVFVGGNVPQLQKDYPGLQKLLFAAVFPVGFILTILYGAELFTGNTLVVLFNLFHRKEFSWKKFLYDYFHFSKNMFLSFVFNVLGAFLTGYLFVYLTQPCCDASWISFVKNLAESKVSKTFGQFVLLGIICNALVTSGVYVAMTSNTAEGKAILAYIPIFCFVACGFEHSIANAYYIPLGMLYGAKVSVYEFLIVNLLPVTIGNIIGGSLVVGCVMFYVYDIRLRYNRWIRNGIKKMWNFCKSKKQSENNITNEGIEMIDLEKQQ